MFFTFLIHLEASFILIGLSLFFLLIGISENRFENERNNKVKSEPVSISGRIVDHTTGQGIPFVTIRIEQNKLSIRSENPVGVVSGSAGEFELKVESSLPLTLDINHISYQKKFIQIEDSVVTNLVIELVPSVMQGQELVVVSSLVEREQLESTITVERISPAQIQQVASFDAFDLISTLRGVDIATQSMNLQTISTRGFNTGANARFLQLTDGVDSQAPGLGFPIGNLLGPSELDIASIELMVGPASARYGSSAMSGVLQTETRDPFMDRGFSANLKGGVHGLKLGGAEPLAARGDGMYDFSGRFAHVFNERLAIKLTGTWIEGTDWRANNYDNIGWGDFWMQRDTNPGYNGVNVYGDENFVYLPVGLDKNDNPDGSLVPVTRTGYREEDLVNYDIATRKASAALHYRLSETATAVVEGRYGYTNTLYTADSRIRLQDFEIFQLNTELNINEFYMRAYTTRQYSGSSYDVFYLANNLLNEAKTDSDWFRDYRMVYSHGYSLLNIPAGDARRARQFADSAFTLIHNRQAHARFEPDTPEFEEKLTILKSTHDFNTGAGIRDHSQLYNIDSGISLPDLVDGIHMETGINFRFYDLDSGGTIFPDTTGNHITNYQFGGFVSSEMSLAQESLNLNLSLRFDKNENFRGSLSPQVGIGYILNDEHFFRFSYQYGFRYPTVREQFMNQNIGNARILGGLRQITDQYNFHYNSITEQALSRYNDAIVRDMNPNPLIHSSPYTREQAEIRNLHILEDGIIGDQDLTPLRPEKNHALEVGYRHLFTRLLYLDLNYYVNFYNDFIGLVRLVKPRTSPVLDLYTASGQVNNSTESDRFYVNSNASERVTIHGISFDAKYQSGGFFAGVNGTYTRLLSSPDDPIIPGFNTPPFKLNFEWGNREIAEYVGFKMVYRLRTGHFWESPFLDGKIDTYGHFDFQVNVRIPKLGSMVKAGFTNMGVNNYYNVYGGPQIGSIIFATFTYNPKLF